MHTGPLYITSSLNINLNPNFNIFEMKEYIAVYVSQNIINMTVQYIYLVQWKFMVIKNHLFN